MYVEFFIFKGVPSADREISRRFFIETKKAPAKRNAFAGADGYRVG